MWESGYVAERCYHCFGISFQGHLFTTFFRKQISLPWFFQHCFILVACQLIAPQPEFVDHNCWFPDSGATNHVTNDLHSLAICSKYTSIGKIHMSNGTGLPISSISHTSFNSISLILHPKNHLHVPLITKNLLSVSQFCVDKKLSFEFHPNSYLLKIKQPREAYLKELLVGVSTSSIWSSLMLLLKQLPVHLIVLSQWFLVNFLCK